MPALLGLLVLFSAGGFRTPAALAAPGATPTSCAVVHANNPAAGDGSYALLLNGNILTVYCANMATNPTDYLTLVNTGSNLNFGQYTAGGNSPGTSVRTNYTKVRIDPATLKVNIADQTFSTSTGSLSHVFTIPVTSMPYAVAMGCQAPLNANGLANIDLTGTPLAVVNTFVTGGSRPAGSATFTANGQVVNLTGGGNCGWNGPAPLFNPFNQNPANDGNGGFDLQLSFTGPGGVSQCFNGAWQSFGVFKNQGDCVSFVSSGGTNQPG